MHFVRETLDSLIHPANTKIVKSLWMLVRRPGYLTLAYMEGRRVPYLHPFRVFLVANVIFFLFATIFGSSPLTTKLATHIESENFFHQDIAERIVAEEVETKWPSYETYEATFDRRIDTFSKTLVFAMIPIMAGLLGLVFVFRKEFAVKHLAFACHAYAFLLLYNFLLFLSLFSTTVVGLLGIHSAFSRTTLEIIYSTAGLLIQSAFFFFGFRRAYRTNKGISLVLALAFGLLIYVILLIYRAILFFATFYSLA